jgi:hypothetical protein
MRRPIGLALAGALLLATPATAQTMSDTEAYNDYRRTMARIVEVAETAIASMTTDLSADNIAEARALTSAFVAELDEVDARPCFNELASYVRTSAWLFDASLALTADFQLEEAGEMLPAATTLINLLPALIEEAANACGER